MPQLGKKLCVLLGVNLRVISRVAACIANAARFGTDDFRQSVGLSIKCIVE